MRSLDCPARIILTAGQRGDAPQAAALLGEDRPDGRLADAAYGANHFREAITKAGAVAIIPNNPSRMKKRPIDRLFGRVIEGYGVDIVLIAIPHGPPSNLFPHIIFLSLAHGCRVPCSGSLPERQELR